MGRVRFRGRDWVKSIFLDNNVDPGSSKDVDPGTCLTWQNHGDHVKQPHLVQKKNIYYYFFYIDY